MKVLTCPCGRVRVGVPRRQQFCSPACARARVLEHLAANRANRTKRLEARLSHLSQVKAYQLGLQKGWNVGYRKGLASSGAIEADA